MADLRARILERVDQLEATARAAGGKTWAWVRTETGQLVDTSAAYPSTATEDGMIALAASGGSPESPEWLAYIDDMPNEVARFIAGWSPAAVLTLCAGARRLVELHQPEPGSNEYGEITICDTCGNRDREYGDTGDWPCDTIRVVARMLGIDPDGDT